MVTYQEAGVNQVAKDRLVDRILRLSEKTFGPGVIRNPWGFAGLFSLKEARLFGRSFSDPVLMGCADGVGTKIKIACAVGNHRGIGIDLVAMNVNDLIVTGGTPLFFLDYIAMSKAQEDLLLQLVEGMVEGCRQAGCALLGGETAEMPGHYAPGEYDLAGFAVGIGDRNRLLDAKDVAPGDVVLGLASQGVHSNGFSLVRKIIDDQFNLSDRPGGLDCPLGEELLRPTRIYVKAMKAVLKPYQRKRAIKSAAHITGGGLVENLPRAFPQTCAAEIRDGSWPHPPIFNFLQEAGRISTEEMRKVFNLGIGLCLIVAPRFVRATLLRLRRTGYPAWEIGRIVKGEGEVRFSSSA
jgi:phosphoribosylformylglycinamidine cyclo-ligase